MDVVSLSSEFPNDNPALHCGAIWICDEPTGPARAERVVRPMPVAEVETSPPDVVLSAIAAAVLTPSVIAEVLAMAEPESEDSELVAAPEADEEMFASPELEAEPIAAFDHEPDEDIVVEELEPIDTSLEGEIVALAATELEPPTEIAVAAEAPVIEEIEIAPATVVAEVMPPVVEEIEVAPATVVATPIFEEVVACEVVPAESSVLPAAPDDPFTSLVCTLADVAIGAGSPHVASMLPGLLFDARLPEPLDPEIAGALEAAGIVSAGEISSAFIAVTTAWKAILRGTSDDFDACGAAMLDEWCSDLLARLLAAPGRAPTLRQELRTRGVAAFGIAA